MNTSRLKILQAKIQNPILIKKKENLFYLTGRSFDIRAEEYLLVSPRRKNADKGRTNTDVVGFGSGLEAMHWIKNSDSLKNIGKYLKKQKRLDLEWGFNYGEGEYIKSKLKDLGLKIEVKPELSPVDQMRVIKEPMEIALVKKSMQIVEAVFKLVRKEIKKPGMTEEGLAKFIESAGLKLGAEDVSFPAIVASGANAAIPHHVPSKKKLKTGESIILDFGFKYKNYCSDFTRTVFLKTAPAKLADAYNQVEEAYNQAINFTKSGTLADKVYDLSVKVLAEKDLDKYFIHSLGHGTGLEIHELPNISPKSKSIMQNNMVFSIEPGVYLPSCGGIRIEDLVYLKQGNVEKFINVPTKLKDNII
ncbi:MAG: M24 family metallopeptidase [Candidatus Doudnabacteria bacterium]|nr:M24 family metallopeptidase [Candidatus Doudnabacteria bacterium]